MNEIDKYGIRKKSRSTTEHSYTGPTWQAINVYKPPTEFSTLLGASLFASMLSKHNPVGFEVFVFTN